MNPVVAASSALPTASNGVEDVRLNGLGMTTMTITTGTTPTAGTG